MTLDMKLLVLCEINGKYMYFDFVLQRSLYLFITRKLNYVNAALCVRLKTDTDFHLVYRLLTQSMVCGGTGRRWRKR
jgi:hypothetical protein